MNLDNTLLRVKNLSLGLNNPKNEKLLIDNVSFDIKKNEIVSIIGESGSGKTLTAMSILGLLDKALFNISGHIIFNVTMMIPSTICSRYKPYSRFN